MKKHSLVITLLLVAFVATGAFAETPAPSLKFNGYLDTGVRSTGFVNRAATYGAFGDDSGVNFGRFDLSGSYANGDNGVNFTLRFQGDKSASAVTSSQALPMFDALYAYTDILNKMVRVEGGFLAINAWTPNEDKIGSYVGDGNGAVGVGLEIKPFDGLNFGVASLTTTVAGGLPLANDGTNVNSVVIGGSYTATPLFNLYAQYSVAKTASGFILGASTTPVSGLFIAAAGYVSVVNDYSNKGSTIIDEKITYSGLDKFVFGLVAYQWLYGTSTAAPTGAVAADKTGASVSNPVGLRFTPYIDYALDKITTLELGVGYYSYTGVSAAQGSAAIGSTDKITTDTALFEVTPKVSFQFDPNSLIYVLDSIDASIGANDKAFGDSKIANTFKVSYRYRF